MDGRTLGVKYEREFVRVSGAFWGLSMSVLVLERSELAATPTERLEAEATSLAGHLAAAMCRFLDVVAELAQREAWKTWEARSMAHWVSWKCGVGPRAAQEQVRVALALQDLPETHAEFASGQLSYSKVRALTRFLTPGKETDTIVVARHTTAEQLERIARAHGSACRAADPDLTRRALDASYVAFHTNDDGMMTITARVPADVGVRALKAVDDAASRLPRHPDAEPQTKRVNGFEAVIDAYLEPDPDRSGAVEVIAHVDVEMLSQDVPGRCELDGHPIASETLRRLARDCGVRLSIDADGQILDLGRKARFPNPALRRSVVTRDQGRCRFPGCTQRTRLRAHHVRHWAHGGTTDRTNLLMLCPVHHRSVHEGGWNIEADGRGGFTFFNPRGVTVPELVLVPTPTLPDVIIRANADAGIAITPDSIASLSGGERMDLDCTMTAIFCVHPPVPRPRVESVLRNASPKPTCPLSPQRFGASR